jgi:hypothetical protein
MSQDASRYEGVEVGGCTSGTVQQGLRARAKTTSQIG